MNRLPIGYLTVNVRFANGASPVGDSRIVLEKNGSFFGEFFTDADGKTDTIPLSAGDIYSMKVYADGFYEKEYNDIPIVGKITTLQNVNLFPRDEG
ncbi:MAG: hypothetical protein IJN17_00730 [Clostridia bacterium]|nr:hypothetical protein [Clostridia bacterium]